MSRRRRSLGVAVCVSLVVLATAPAAGAQSMIPEPRSAAWVDVARTADAVVRMDTTQLIDYGEYVGVWLYLRRAESFRDATGVLIRDAAFFEEVDCERFRSRRWEIRAIGPDEKEIETKQMFRSGWAAFRLHPIGENPFVQVCIRLGAIRRQPRPACEFRRPADWAPEPGRLALLDSLLQLGRAFPSTFAALRSRRGRPEREAFARSIAPQVLPDSLYAFHTVEYDVDRFSFMKPKNGPERLDAVSIRSRVDAAPAFLSIGSSWPSDARTALGDPQSDVGVGDDVTLCYRVGSPDRAWLMLEYVRGILFRASWSFDVDRD